MTVIQGARARTGLQAACIAAICAAAIGAAQQPAPPVFTAEQAAAGRAADDASCASCHVADLGGRTRRLSSRAATS